jgi:protease-4
MFSRRHPFLFFILSLCTICASALVVITLVVAIGFGSLDRPDMRGGGDNLVGIVEVTGIIYDSDTVIRQIKEFREDDTIKAILLRINSPGGTVGPAQEIYREIEKTVPVKKVVASMGTVAASGGYYIAAATDGIMANPGTITGSIGVIMSYTNYKELFEKIGLSSVVIKSGEYKDIGSPIREMTEVEQGILQNFVDGTKKQFVEAVAAGRDMPLDRATTLADGRIYTGEEARDNGLVDRLGNLEDAIAWTGELAGIEGEISTVYAREAEYSLLDILLGTTEGSIIEKLSQRLMLQAAYLLDVQAGGIDR